MTLPPDDALDALLRDQLDRQAERIDPRPLFHAIMARSATAGRPASTAASAPPRTTGGARAARFLASAAALAACLLLGLYLAPAWQAHAATAEELVREARAAHRQPLDRCYLVELRASSLPDESAPLREASRTNRLWTRGDRFWMESANPTARWAWGRDDRGGLWIAAFGGRAGVRLDADEVPRSLDAACDVMSMRPDTLLDDVLRDFDLRREPPAADAPGVRVIDAALKPGHAHPALAAARLELDAETRVIRRLVLHRTRGGQPVATVTYTLVETAPQDDGKYALDGHLLPPAEVYTRDRDPARRRDILRLWLGGAADWSRPKK